MAYCRKCGAPISDSAQTCPRCGAYQSAPQPRQTSEDKGGVGLCALGCCIPLAGLILYLVWKDEKPESAKAAGIGALISVGLSLLITLINFLSGFAYAFF